MLISNHGANQDTPHPVRRIVGLPSASYALLRRLADLQGVPMSTAIHDALRAEAERLTGESTLTPHPFSVEPVRIDGDYCVRLAHPLFPTAILRQREAELLASTLFAAGQATPRARCEFSTARGLTTLKIVQGGRCVHLTANGCAIALTRPVALDLSRAIEAARVDALIRADAMPAADLGAYSKLRPDQPRQDNGLAADE